jgi:hypothetical protein
MNNSHANPEDANGPRGYGDDGDGTPSASKVGSGEPAPAGVMPASLGICDELEEGRMFAGVRRWSDLLDRPTFSSS